MPCGFLFGGEVSPTANMVQVPRLRERSLAAFGAWSTFRRPSEVFTAREKRWFIVYGLLVFCYAMFHLGLIAYFFWGNLVPLYEGRGALAALYVCGLITQQEYDTGKVPGLERLVALERDMRAAGVPED